MKVPRWREWRNEIEACPQAELQRRVRRLGQEMLDAFGPAWVMNAHEEQLPPEGDDWRIWLMMAGRGFGKTRAGAEWVSALARMNPTLRIALVGATIEEVARVMVRGQSGLIAVAAADSDLLSRGDGDARYQPADSDLTAIAALSTTSFGRGLLTVANAAAGRTALGLGTAAVAATGTGASDVPTTAAADARYLRSVAPALNSDGSAGSTWTAISGPAFGTSTNSTGSSNFPSTFGGTISFKLDTSASSWARAFDLWKANQTTNLYLRAYSATGTPTAWVQIWHDGNDGAGSGLDADKLDGQEGSYYAPIASPNFSGTAQYGGIEIGWRDLPRTTSGLTRGQCLATSAGVTITAGAAAGSCYAVYNDSGAAITLTQGSGLTLRLAGSTTTGSRTLAARGFATIWFNSTSEAIVSGTGVS